MCKKNILGRSIFTRSSTHQARSRKKDIWILWAKQCNALLKKIKLFGSKTIKIKVRDILIPSCESNENNELIIAKNILNPLLSFCFEMLFSRMPGFPESPIILDN